VSRVAGGERSWARLSRRHLARGLYLPGTQQARLRAVVAVDTSGSTHALVPRFLAELRALLASFGRYEIELVWCDCEVQAVQTFSDVLPEEAPREVPLGGGTDFRPAFAHADAGEVPDVLVYLTDGDGPAPTHAPPYPTLWILPHSATPPAPWGEVAWLREDEHPRADGTARARRRRS
jgi:predicted metal-dependent peptidase